VLADVFEAIVAAIFIDSGGLTEPSKLILRFLPSAEVLLSEKNVLKDYKTILQEFIQQNPEEKIIYEITAENGPAHARTFEAAVTLNGQVIGSGNGNSKKQAEQEAAKVALALFGVR
jgi:ribonuclease-3